MKRRKNRKAARAIASARALERKASQAVLAYDIARYSAETIFYRVKMAQRTAMEPFGPEAFAMASEKMLAASEVMVIALRQLGPLQRLWTQAWFGQLSALQQSWQPRRELMIDVGHGGASDEVVVASLGIACSPRSMGTAATNNRTSAAAGCCQSQLAVA
jgi:hypothetical protein